MRRINVHHTSMNVYEFHSTPPASLMETACKVKENRKKSRKERWDLVNGNTVMRLYGALRARTKDKVWIDMSDEC